MRLAPPPAFAWAAAGLALLYTAATLGHPSLPGNNPANPLGWWGWWDQSLYLRALRGFAAGNLEPAEHWYPPGYALLGAPFSRALRAHPFFFVNLACLVGSAWFFLRFCARVGVGPRWAMLLFAAPLLDWRLLEAWVVPWSTTPTALCLWAMLWLAAEWFQGRRRPVALGVLPAAVMLLRPSDMLVPGLILAVIGVIALRQHDWRSLGRLILAGAAGLFVALGLHLAIHGVAASAYMHQSADLGFSLHAFGWKAFVLLVEPRAWYGDGMGLLARHPWMALAVIGMPFAWRAGPAMRLLVLGVVGQMALYIAYVDLLPTGFWRYGNVHYWKWLVPGIGLIALVGLRGLMRAPGWARGAAVGGALAVMALRITPAPGEPARALELPGPTPPFTDIYFAPLALTDSAGTQRNILDLRLVPFADGVRAIGLRRDFVLPLLAAPGLDLGPARPLAARLGFGWFCWLPPYGCRD